MTESLYSVFYFVSIYKHITFLGIGNYNFKWEKSSCLLLVQTYLVAFKRSIVNFNIHKHATLKIDVAFFSPQIWKQVRYLPEHLWGICLGFQFDNVFCIIPCIYTSLTKENIRELSFPDSSDIALQIHFGDRITCLIISANLGIYHSFKQAVIHLYLFSQNVTLVWIKPYDTYLHWYKLFFQIFVVKISFSEKKIRQVQHTKWDELCPQRKLVFPFQFHFKEIWQVWLWTNFNSTISFV